jgi:hypothetical protein
MSKLIGMHYIHNLINYYVVFKNETNKIKKIKKKEIYLFCLFYGYLPDTGQRKSAVVESAHSLLVN